MNPVSLIAKKRDGARLTRDEIQFLVQGFVEGQIPDYQMSALAMAIYFQGMDLEETADLTRAYIDSGIRLKWPKTPPHVDKHSTGGVGDKISIPLAPMLASCGVAVPMISGRGLGTTGGTLDKLESIPGFRTELSVDEFRAVVNWVKCAIVSASRELAPADRKMYALRDVTATVPSIPLITASILSKKVAEGISSLVLDVKCGSGAFMKTLDDARQLAHSLVHVANRLGVTTSALITDMNQPLGKMIGNAVEVDESVDVLNGQGPDDVVELTLRLGARLLVMAGVEKDEAAATRSLQKSIDDGTALKTFREMVRNQGGDLDAPRPRAPAHDVTAHESGFVSRIDCERLGWAVIEMGGGRKKMGDPIDHSVGIEFLVELGQQITEGEVVARIFCPPELQGYATELVRLSIGTSPDRIPPGPLVIETIT